MSYPGSTSTPELSQLNQDFHPRQAGDRERCVLVSVDTKLEARRGLLGVADTTFSFDESLSELCELCATAGLAVVGSCVQRMYRPNMKTYIGPGKVAELMTALNLTDVRTVVFDDDLSTKQQRSLEDGFAAIGGSDVKVLYPGPVTT